MVRKKTEASLTEQIREAIRADGRSFNQLGRDAGVAPSQLTRFVTDGKSLKSDTLDRLCRALRLKLVPEQTTKEN